MYVMTLNCIHFSASSIKMSPPPPSLPISPLQPYSHSTLSFDRVSIAQPSLKRVLLLPQPSSFWNYRYVHHKQLSAGCYHRFCPSSLSAALGVLSTASWMEPQVPEIKWLFKAADLSSKSSSLRKAHAVNQHALPSIKGPIKCGFFIVCI